MAAATPVTGTHRAFRLIGRSDLRKLTAAVASREEGAPVALLLVGEPGIGKSTLLLDAVGTASRQRIRVLFSAGGQPDLLPAYASMTELLWPIINFADTLAPGLRDTLFDVLGASTQPAPRGPVIIRQALLALLKAAGAEQSLLIAVDDVDGLDRDSRETLISAIRWLVDAPVSVLMTARRREALPGVDASTAVLEVPPLADREASDLLEAQTPAPEPSVRGEIIRWSAGNPLALIESARVYGRTGATVFRANSMPGYGGAHSIFSLQLAELGAETRKLLLYAAAGAGDETIDTITQAAGYHTDFSGWQSAQTAGLISLAADRRITFCHPLLRALAYADASLAQQREAHLALAESPLLDASCRAWHLAAATPGPDETIAAALEQSARLSRRRGGYLQVARALHRAAELSPQPEHAARRYAEAAAAANFGGDPAWGLVLSQSALKMAADPDVLAHASLTRASIRLQSAQPFEAFDLAKGCLDSATPPTGRLALALTYLGASASYYSGDIAHRRALPGWLHRLRDIDEGADGGPAEDLLTFPPGAAPLQRAYISMYAATVAHDTRPAAVDKRWLSPQSSVLEPFRHLVVGVMAWVTEETALAAQLLTQAVDSLKASGGLRGFTYAMAPLAWALLDTGRWGQLDELLDTAADLCATHDLKLLDVETIACRAQLLAYRGDVEGAARALHDADANAVDATLSATRVALTRAAGWIAIAESDYDRAYLHLREQFLSDGTPSHFVVSDRAIGELAWAAARSGRIDEAQSLITAIAHRLGPEPPVRLQLLHHQALALVAPAAAAESHFRLAVFNPAGDQWPLERARARLHYGEWLRRARRPADAKPLLTAALATFDRLGAAPLSALARAELRAAGVAPKNARTPGAFTELTAQERQIVRLAASGLTNRQIGEQLNLSPRTIASHLYHVYPKLGVSRRHELRDLAE
jgi:DNA-binding CsgD family transcriptional regulator